MDSLSLSLFLFPRVMRNCMVWIRFSTEEVSHLVLVVMSQSCF